MCKRLLTSAINDTIIQLTFNVMKDYYLTGDLTKVDEDNYFCFNGRSIHLIASSGYLIGSTEVALSLMNHPAVFEVAFVGKANARKAELVKIFINQFPKTQIGKILGLFIT